MSPSDWNDDEQDPPAPLPSHERIWRHPSEIGQQAWQQTEPPLAIGRGLTAATGVVGGVLGVVLLWTMLTTEAGRGAVATARSTIVTLTEGNFGSDLVTQISTSLPPASTTSIPARPTSATVPSTRPIPAVESLIKTPVPTWIVHSTSSPAKATSGSDPGRTLPVLAVPVNHGALAITTAQAVNHDQTVHLELTDGTRADARVLFVDERTGLAVLAPQVSHPTLAFTVAAAIEPGDQLTFLGGDTTTTTVGPDGSIAGTWSDDPSIPEGTPVVNQRGELVALCSHRSGSSVRGSAAGVPHLVVLETLDDIRQALSALQGTAPVWLGVVINDDPGGALSVGAVDPAGPAHAGGLTAGDVILAVDDDQITDGRALIAHLGLHRPGDVVRIAIRHADGTKAVIAITLAAPKTAL